MHLRGRRIFCVCVVASTKIIQNFRGNPCGSEIPPLSIKSLLESNPLKSRILVRRLAVHEDLLLRWWACVAGRESGSSELTITAQKDVEPVANGLRRSSDDVRSSDDQIGRECRPTEDFDALYLCLSNFESTWLNNLTHNCGLSESAHQGKPHVGSSET